MAGAARFRDKVSQRRGAERNLRWIKAPGGGGGRKARTMTLLDLDAIRAARTERVPFDCFPASRVPSAAVKRLLGAGREAA